MTKELKKSEEQVMAEAEEISQVSRIISQVEQVGLSGLGDANTMKQKLKDYDKVREVILDYIERNLIKEVDFGWTDERSIDKATLKKPGAEKVCRMFNTHPRWIRDFDTWEMVGKPPGVIFLICQIVDNETNNVIGEGRGAAKIGEKQRDANKTIKNAEKCALVDAALYTFMLSEKFTQDDGGTNKQATLTQWKKELIADVGTYRTGIKSKLSDHAWIQEVVNSELRKGRVDTIGEYKAVRKAIFEENKYEKETGQAAI